MKDRRAPWAWMARGVVLGVAALLAGAAGCATGAKPMGAKWSPVRDPQAAELDGRAEAVRLDPVAYLRDVTERASQLEQYTMTFVRQERRGIIPVLHEPERIAAWFRREPFSVRMKWLDPDVKYGESTFVAGQRGDRVRFVARRGFLGLKPGIVEVDLRTPVVWGEARYPLTDFGLQRMMERTLESIERANGDYSVEYLGLSQVGDPPVLAHHIRLEYPPSQHKAPVQELFVDARTDLPAGTFIRYADGALEAAYVYQQINPRVKLADEDFLLEAERTRASVSASN